MEEKAFIAYVTFYQVLAVLFFSVTSEAAKPLNHSSNISSLLVFGDSTVDPGNNNFIGTIFNSNFEPYGRDLPAHIPQGRFTNGKLVTDFVAEYVGLKEAIPPYLDPALSIQDLITGVSFASAVSGYDPLTPQLTGVIPMQDQVKYFREYKNRIRKEIGDEKTKDHIDKAIFLISAGTNDYDFTYFDTKLRQNNFSVPEYQEFLLKNVEQFIQDTVAEGAKRIAITSLPPIGCLPLEITLFSDSTVLNRQCISQLSSAAINFNDGLQKLLNRLRLPDVKLIYADIYTPLLDMINNPRKYGFTHTNNGCCGSGLFEAGPLCNPVTVTCSDASKYVFWDSVHPTQTVYYNLFQTLRPVADALK